MGIYAELLISDIERRVAEGKLYGKVETHTQSGLKSPTPELIEAALAASEEILTDVRDNVQPIRDMPFNIVTRQNIYAGKDIVLLQWSPRPQEGLIRPFYTKEKRATSPHYGLSIQVDEDEGSVRVQRPSTREILSTEGQPLGIEGFAEDPRLIIPNLAGALLRVLAFASNAPRSRRRISVNSGSLID